MLTALSPLDGRYSEITSPLRAFFSEEALIRARVMIEISYFIALSKETGVKELRSVNAAQQKKLWNLVARFSTKDAQAVKKLEAVTKHDVKAAEYWLTERVKRIPGLARSVTFIHFALTSEDVNNLAYGILIHEALVKVITPALESLLGDLTRMARGFKNDRMLSLTHGQPATPTTVGKELMVFVERLGRQVGELETFRMGGKLGGAVGNFAAHRAAYPTVNWERFRDRFVKALGLIPLRHTTQINPHDDVAELSHLMHRINSIFLNLSRDCWMYISRGVFRQRAISGEVGSSTMPHKVNPIDFENAEGNLGLANALFNHFAEKLPISRLQRDLSDSTVQRSIGSAFGYHLLAVTSLQKGLSKLSLDSGVLTHELDAHPEVVAEAIQTVLRKHGVEGAYEKLKKLTRGERVTKEQLRDFVEGLGIPKEEKEKLQKML